MFLCQNPLQACGDVGLWGSLRAQLSLPAPAPPRLVCCSLWFGEAEALYASMRSIWSGAILPAGTWTRGLGSWEGAAGFPRGALGPWSALPPQPLRRDASLLEGLRDPVTVAADFPHFLVSTLVQPWRQGSGHRQQARDTCPPSRGVPMETPPGTRAVCLRGPPTVMAVGDCPGDLGVTWRLGPPPTSPVQSVLSITGLHVDFLGSTWSKGTESQWGGGLRGPIQFFTFCRVPTAASVPSCRGQSSSHLVPAPVPKRKGWLCWPEDTVKDRLPPGNTGAWYREDWGF